MSAYFSPVGNEQHCDADGAPLVGGKLYTYRAGTTTAVDTYTTAAGTVAQANPIILDGSGRCTNPIYLPAGVAVKLVLKDSAEVTLAEWDEVTGVNDPSTVTSTDQWVTFSGTPTYVSATSFSVSGDQTLTLHIGRRLKTTNSGGTVYSTITNASYAASVTTVTVANDSGTLDSGLSAVSYGLASYANTSLPIIAFGRSSTYSDATASRAINTTYTNNTGKPLFVAASVAGTTNASTVSIGWTVGAVGGISQSSLIAGTPASNTTLGASAIVPPGSTYRLAVTQGSLSQWLEMS